MILFGKSLKSFSLSLGIITSLIPALNAAALRAGIKEVIIPKDNEKDLRDLPNNITEKLKIHPVKFVDELFAIALKTKPTKLKPRQKKPLVRKDTSSDVTKNLQ